VKKEKPLYRILEKHSKFYPQWRGWFFWNYFEADPDTGEVKVWKETLTAAKQYIKFHIQAVKEVEEMWNPKIVIHSFE